MLAGTIDPELVGHEGSSIGMLLLFSTNLIVLGALPRTLALCRVRYFMSRRSSRRLTQIGCIELGIRANPALSRLLAKESELENASGVKKLAKPLAPTLTSVRELSREVR